MPVRVTEDSIVRNLPQQDVRLGGTSKPKIYELAPKSELVAFAPSPTPKATLSSAIKRLPQKSNETLM